MTPLPDSSPQPVSQPKRVKVLYAAMKYDYGIPEQGFGNEHFNFYDTLLRLGCEVVYFDTMTLLKRHGRKRMNERLREVVDEEKPDLLFCVLYKYEIDKEVMRKITEETDTLTMNWFADDIFRFKGYSSRWSRCFDWIVTADEFTVPRYKKLGAKNVVYLRWACNPFLYKTSDKLAYDVTFVGQPHSKRREAVAALKSAGIRVDTWGRGWDKGRLSQDDMIRVFGSSRINLNFSDASARPGLSGKLGLKLPKQIKARLLEVPACGGFLLTGDAPALPQYYQAGKDVVVFHSTEDLVKKVRYYLAHEDERAAIAKTGYETTMREHTYAHRFAELFGLMNLPAPTPADVLSGKVPLGTTKEITIETPRPLVSVVMAVYNGEKYVARTIDSILGQHFQDFEFVIVDDGSTDSTLSILDAYAAKDARIKIHRLSHTGKVTAFNTGFQRAQGEFIALTGADDISLPIRLTQQVNFLQEHADIGVVGSWVELIDGDSKPYGSFQYPTSPAVIAWSLCLRSPIAAPAAMMRRSVVESVGWCRETASEDYDLWSRISMKTDLANMPKILVQYRIWPGNFSSTHKPQEEETARMVIQERAQYFLGEKISDEAALALRLPIEGSATASLDQIKMASTLYRRLYRAFIRKRPLSFADSQTIRNMVSEYELLLATHAKKKSTLSALPLKIFAVLRNPLFLHFAFQQRRARLAKS